MRKNGIAILALVLCLLCLALTALVWLNADQALRGQGVRLTQLEKKVEALEARLEQLGGGQLELTDYTLTAKAWPDAAGADVTLRAVPETYDETLEVAFFVESMAESGASAREVLCQWDGTAYTATVSLNAANEYCYYLTAGEDNWITLAVPDGVGDMTCVYLADSLAGYLVFELESWSAAEGTLTLDGGSGVAQLPLFDQSGQEVSAEKVQFALKLGDQTLSSVPVEPAPGEGAGSLEIYVQDLSLDLPALEEEQQVELWLEVALSNGGQLTTLISGWTVTDGQLGQVAG